MNTRLPVSLAPNLTITVGNVSTRITPHAGFDLAQKLLRASSRVLVAQETERSVRAGFQRKPASRQ